MQIGGVTQVVFEADVKIGEIHMEGRTDSPFDIIFNKNWGIKYDGPVADTSNGSLGLFASSIVGYCYAIVFESVQKPFPSMLLFGEPFVLPVNRQDFEDGFESVKDRFKKRFENCVKEGLGCDGYEQDRA